AKNSHYSATIGRGDDAGRSWLCPADSTSKHSGGNDSSGSCSHNESGHHRKSSGEEGDNRGKERGASSAYHAKRQVQLRSGNEYRDRLQARFGKAGRGGRPESLIPGSKGRPIRG